MEKKTKSIIAISAALVVIVGVVLMSTQTNLFQGFMGRGSRDVEKSGVEMTTPDVVTPDVVTPDVVTPDVETPDVETYNANPLKAAELSKDGNITRCGLAYMVIQGLGIPDRENADVEGNQYSDVPDELWCGDYINTASSLGLMIGYVDGTFKPEGTVSRAEAVKVVVTAFELSECKYGNVPFDDYLIDSWFAPYVSTAVHFGLFEAGGRASSFEPDSLATLKFVIDIVGVAKNPQVGDPDGFTCVSEDDTSSLRLEESTSREEPKIPRR
jgi:hypothetical protein